MKKSSVSLHCDAGFCYVSTCNLCGSRLLEVFVPTCVVLSHALFSVSLSIWGAVIIYGGDGAVQILNLPPSDLKACTEILLHIHFLALIFFLSAWLSLDENPRLEIIRILQSMMVVNNGGLTSRVKSKSHVTGRCALFNIKLHFFHVLKELAFCTLKIQDGISSLF